MFVGVGTAQVLAPPPARGWTQGGYWEMDAQLGSPARAGMDPRLPGLGSVALWLPRPRGDGPPSAKRRGSEWAIFGSHGRAKTARL